MIHAAIFVLSFSGFALLLLAMPRHQQEWFRYKLSPASSRKFRKSGFVALVLAFAVAAMGFGWGYGTVAWFGWLTVAAALVVIANIQRKRIMGKVRQ